MDHGRFGAGRAKLAGVAALVRRLVAWPAGGAAVGLVLPLLLAACSATSSVQHSPAKFAPIESARMVDDSPDRVRQRLVSRVPESGLELMETDASSNVIRLSLRTDQPGAYVDCGRTRRTFEGPWGDAETFEYEPAASASYKLTSYDGVPLEARRDVALAATATVRLTPDAASAAMTEVSVAISYDLETQVAYRERGLFALAAGPAEPVTQTIRFRTDRPGVGDGEVAACMSNGKLEAQILDLATQRTTRATRAG